MKVWNLTYNRFLLKKNNMKKVIVFALLLFLEIPVYSAPGTIVTYTIDPEKNAYNHNNKGVEYLSEKYYYGAIQEFKIAISLNPNTQATAVYFNNLGKTYLIIGFPELALDCFKNAVKQYSMNFEYYENLAKCYKQLAQTDKQLSKYKNDVSKNPLNQVMVGLLEEQSGNKRKAITTFDDFAQSEPNLLITPAIRQHIKDLVKQIRDEE